MTLAMPEMRQLGSSGIATPPLVLGGNVFGWTASEAESFRILDAFVAGGGTLVDTADVYSSWVPGHAGGESETVIGNWLARRGRRDDVLIATKVGYSDGLRREVIERAVDASLRRLRTSHIDLYYTHRDDRETPLEETLEALDVLVRAGKVRAIGASQIEADRLEQALATSRANGWASYSVLQTLYNLVEREPYEAALAEVAGRLGLGVCAYFGLASGYLTGKYRTPADLAKSVRGDTVTKYMDGKGPAVLSALDEVAAEAGATPAQVALAWIAAQPTLTAPIASATSLDQLEELMGSLRLTLSPAQLERLDRAST